MSSRETRDVALLESVLRREPVWGGYGLGDLGDTRLFQHTRWFLSGDEAALALLFQLGDTTTLMTHGAADAIAEVVRELPLPARFHAHLPVAHHAALGGVLGAEEDLARYVRLDLSAETLRPPPSLDGAAVTALTLRDLAAVEALYAHYRSNWFEPSRLERGGYLGVRLEGTLAAVGGTHVASDVTRVAALGDIVTDPAARGRGLATLLTHALCAHHLERGIDLVVLNVKTDNPAARRAYAKVGFGRDVPHVEGHMRRL